MNPLLTFFSTDQSHYIYDTSSNKILKTEKDRWRELKNLYEKGELQKEEHLNLYQDKNLMQDVEVEKLEFETDRDKIKEKLNSGMSRLVLNITSRCNMRCNYCQYSEAYPDIVLNKEKKDMDTGTIESSLDLFKRRTSDQDEEDLKEISFYGGEPLVNFKAIKHAVKEAKKRFGEEIDFKVVTNGILLKEEIAEFLYNQNFQIQVSLDGDKETHNENRVLPDDQPSFSIIKENLEKLRQKDEEYYKEKVIFNATLTPPYELLKINEFFSNNPLTKDNDCFFNFVKQESTSLDWDFSIRESEEYQKKKEKLKELFINAALDKEPEREKIAYRFFYKTLRNIYSRKISTLENTYKPLGTCIAGIKNLFVDVKGNIYPCEKAAPAYKMGSVLKEGFSNERSLNMLDNFTEQMVNKCKRCEALRLCRSCYAKVSHGPKPIDKDKRGRTCNKTKERMKEGLELYCKILEQDPEALHYLIKSS